MGHLDVPLPGEPDFGVQGEGDLVAEVAAVNVHVLPSVVATNRRRSRVTYTQ